MSDREPVDIAKGFARSVAGETVHEEHGRAELATELYEPDLDEPVVALDIDIGEVAAAVILDEDAARELSDQLRDYLAAMRERESEEPVPVDVNPGP
jgi:hypothetical protein